MASYYWNPQQETYLSWIERGSGSCNLIARAGCGKSTTMVEGARRIKNGWAFMGAFNKAIAEELKAKVEAPLFGGGRVKTQVGTLHSAGFRIWREYRPSSDINARKLIALAREIHRFDKKAAGVVADAVSFAKQAGIGIDLEQGYGVAKGDAEFGTEQQWTDLFDHYDVWDDMPEGLGPDRMVQDCRKVLKQSLELCARPNAEIDYDDMIYAPLRFSDRKIGRFDWVMIDEAQDTSDARRMLAAYMLKPGGRFVAVGDPCQCQPAGTMVSVVIEKANSYYQEFINQVPIEKIKKGDMVLSYSPSDSSFVKGRKVLDVAKRKYCGELIRIRAGRRTSRYTTNHKCLVNFAPLRDKYCVYVMQRGVHFRVGMCKMDYGDVGCGVTARGRAEGASAVWILGCFGSHREAFSLENRVTANYGLPQLMFTIKNNSAIDQEVLNSIWSGIASNGDKAKLCLNSFGREMQYPLIKFQLYAESLKRPIVTEACNLMDGCLVLPYFGGMQARKADWEPIKIKREHYEGFVYSLSVEKELYCADGIITHNSIYGFSGARNGAMEVIQKQFMSTNLPLSITYRCPKAIVNYANQWVPDLTAHETAPEGQITELDHPRLWGQQFHVGDAILCRFTRPLIGIAQRLREQSIACHVEGSNAKGLIALACKWGESISIDAMLGHLADWTAAECEKWTRKVREDKVESVMERAGTLKDIAGKMSPEASVAKLAAKIEDLFSGEGRKSGLTLCSVHRSKGREWDRVWWIGPDQYQPAWFAKQEWEQEQERNLQYVAATRVKKELVKVAVRLKQSREEPEWWEV